MLQSLAMGVVDGFDCFACDCSLSPKSLVYHRAQFYLDLGGHWNSLGAQCHHAKQVMKIKTYHKTTDFTFSNRGPGTAEAPSCGTRRLEIPFCSAACISPSPLRSPSAHAKPPHVRVSPGFATYGSLPCRFCFSASLIGANTVTPRLPRAFDVLLIGEAAVHIVFRNPRQRALVPLRSAGPSVPFDHQSLPALIRSAPMIIRVFRSVAQLNVVGYGRKPPSPIFIRLASGSVVLARAEVPVSLFASLALLGRPA